MNWRTLSVVGVAGVIIACDRIPFLRRDQAADTTAPAAPAAAALPADTGAAPAGDTLTTPSATPGPGRRAGAEPAPRQVAAQPLTDEPWTPTDTGTVSPGMTRDQVVAVWGPPVVERTTAAWTYLYYRNGCEVTCGTFDVVFLENNQVVDAIVRWTGHAYAGTSSSPPGNQPAATLPPGTSPGGAE